MTELTPFSPSPDDGAPQANASPESPKAKGKHKRRAGQILTPDQCLGGLRQLPGLVATGLLRPQSANAIRGAFHELLSHHDRASHPGAAVTDLGPEQLSAIRDNPALQQLLEPLLTDEQIAFIMREPNDDGAET
jgi:hypothetical protein